MIELSCQSCGEKVGVQSFLAAARQPCRRCGKLLMGPLDNKGRSIPADAVPLPSGGYETRSSGGMWLGMLVGAFAGVGAVVWLAQVGTGLSGPARNVLLGALMGVLLSPVLVISSFLSMMVLPFSLEGVLGDSLWTRIADANNSRTVRPLLWPFVYYVVLPMAICAYGASKVKPNGPSLAIPAALGAIMLGAILGTIIGSVAGKARRAA